MGSAHIFNVYIDLPKSQYYFTGRMSFWRVVLAVLSILFMSVDTAIDDILIRISRNIKRKLESVFMGIGGLFCPRVAYV